MGLTGAGLFRVKRIPNSLDQLDTTVLVLITLRDNQRGGARRRASLFAKYFGQIVPIGHHQTRRERGVLGKTGSYKREAPTLRDIRNDGVGNVHRTLHCQLYHHDLKRKINRSRSEASYIGALGAKIVRHWYASTRSDVVRGGESQLDES